MSRLGEGVEVGVSGGGREWGRGLGERGILYLCSA